MPAMATEQSPGCSRMGKPGRHGSLDHFPYTHVDDIVLAHRHTINIISTLLNAPLARSWSGLNAGSIWQTHTSSIAFACAYAPDRSHGHRTTLCEGRPSATSPPCAPARDASGLSHLGGAESAAEAEPQGARQRLAGARAAAEARGTVQVRRQIPPSLLEWLATCCMTGHHCTAA